MARDTSNAQTAETFHLKRDIGLLGLTFVSLGSVVGSGGSRRPARGQGGRAGFADLLGAGWNPPRDPRAGAR